MGSKIYADLVTEARRLGLTIVPKEDAEKLRTRVMWAKMRNGVNRATDHDIEQAT